MAENSKTLPRFESLDETIRFFEENDMGEYLDQMPEVEFVVDVQTNRAYVAVESTLSERLSEIARKRGISSETLVNLWLQEKIFELEQKPVYQVAEK